ncbi:MAG: beta-N-acetylhexosaminidase [Candidatus Tectomicrobia bacterium]|nr:beta-N-acetylhexosaminidase [Candidatus Tectomicrobia bacterium]
MPRLTLQQQLGQLLFVGIAGQGVSAELRRALAGWVPGGFVLFKENIGAPEQLADLCAELRAVCLEQVGVPPFIAIDQEGGRVARLGPPFTQVPPMRRLGELGDADLTRRLAAGMAAELRAAGISMNFAPVLDVDSNPANPVIGDRSFSRDPEVVARLGGAFIEGTMSAGVAPVGKHFPGHGDTATDSHFELPIVERPRADLERLELAPFRAACAAGLPALMTAHVLFPALDAALPATLSPAILGDLLRGAWGYDGLVITDDLQMQAIARHFAAEAPLLSLRAGADVLLVCAGVAAAAAMLAQVTEGVRSGALRETRVEESWRRLLRLKETFLFDQVAPPAARLRQAIAASGAAAVVAELAQRAGTAGPT